MAAMIRMIATTINNSINEKPSCRFLIFALLRQLNIDVNFARIAAWRDN
jgi:hypothetical protein